MKAQSHALARHRFLVGGISLTTCLIFPAQAAEIEGDVTPLPWDVSIRDLYIGQTSWGSLSIGAGEELHSGTASNGTVQIGGDTGSSGIATVTGAGSLWDTSGRWLHVGSYGTGTLTIENGGKVSSRVVYLGGNSGSNGTATVTGVGSLWDLAGDGSFYIGNGGTGTLNIENGGTVSSDYSYIGFASGSDGTGSSSNGIVTVTGAGSLWNVKRALNVGVDGTGTLIIEDGGKVVSNGYTDSIGGRVGSSGSVTVSGTGSLLEMSQRGLIVGSRGTGTLTIENGGKVTGKGITSIGLEAGSNGTATVTGANSEWNVVEFAVGSAGTGTLTIEDGGKVVSHSFTSIGTSADSNGTVTVTGAGSQWNASWLTVGNSGTGALTIEDGGRAATSSDYTYIGSRTGSNGIVTVTGAGSQFDMDRDLYVGGHASWQSYGDGEGRSSGTINIENGGKVTSDLTYIGSTSGFNGTATVTGAGSLWAGGSFTVGDFGNGTLAVKDAGEVVTPFVHIGNNSGSSGTVTVTGAGSQLYVLYSIRVGIKGTGALTIEDGGRAFSYGYDSYIGTNSGSNGTATVTGTGSQWDTDWLHVGVNGTGTLTVEDGGQVVSVRGTTIGNWNGSHGIVNINGAGSQWSMTSLVLGDEGTGTLTIENGGRIISNGEAHIGLISGSTGNATVTGAGSQWNTKELRVANGGTGTLTIADGGKVVSDGIAALAVTAGSKGTATVTGSGSEWNVNALVVGYDKTGIGTLTIENGGKVVAGGSTTIGLWGNSVGTVTIAGRGSRLNTETLDVGYESTGTLILENGGLVQVADSAHDSFTIGNNGGYGVIQISSGFFAWNGDHYDALLAMILIGDIQYWDGVSYASLAPGENYLDYFKLEYVTDLANSALFAGNANLDGLDGYTILSTVPEPSTYAAILSLLAIGTAFCMKRRNRVR